MNNAENITSEVLEKLRYPIGKYDRSLAITEASLRKAIDDISALPAELHTSVITLSDEQLDMPYRPSGWTLRQTMHHLADSHMNAFIRMKLALTEENPTIKPYEEARWAELPDAAGNVETSLNLLDGLHKRWVLLMDNLAPEQWKRTFNHPESGSTSLEMAAHLYAWHGNHHYMQIRNLRDRMEG
jgi:hypothetical protein